MDYEVIKKIIKIAEEADISGLSVEKGDFKVEVRRDMPHTLPPAVVQHPVVHVEAKIEKEKDHEEGLLAVTSPMVGTFYRATSPDSPPYVEEGSDIEPGKVVCIIEAMKLFNEIEAEITGKVVKILVKNGSPVEYGQKLLLIKQK